MQDVLNFISSLFALIPDFLLSDPIRYFTGLFILVGVVGIIARFCRI